MIAFIRRVSVLLPLLVVQHFKQCSCHQFIPQFLVSQSVTKIDVLMFISCLKPTQITHSSTLSVMADKTSSITMKVLNMEGKIAKSFTSFVNEGNQELALNLSDLNKGVYVLNAFCGGVFLKSIKFIKQ